MAETAILANSSSGLAIFRARLEARLYLFAVGEIDDLPGAMDELLVEAFRFASLIEGIHDTIHDLLCAWRAGGDGAFKQSKHAERLRELSDDQLDELQRRIEAMKGKRRGSHVDRRRTASS